MSTNAQLPVTRDEARHAVAWRIDGPGPSQAEVDRLMGDSATAAYYVAVALGREPGPLGPRGVPGSRNEALIMLHCSGSPVYLPADLALANPDSVESRRAPHKYSPELLFRNSVTALGQQLDAPAARDRQRRDLAVPILRGVPLDSLNPVRHDSVVHILAHHP